MGPTNSTINNYEILNESIETQSSGGETDELNDCDFSDFDDQETFADFIDEKDSLHSAFITLPDGSLRHKQNCCNADVNKISKPSTNRIFQSCKTTNCFAQRGQRCKSKSTKPPIRW